MDNINIVATLAIAVLVVIVIIFKLKSRLKSHEDKSEEVYVYIIENTYLHDTKIGISNNPEKRIKQLQTGNSRQLVIKYTIKFNTRNEANKLEYALHKKYSKHRLCGEWFEIDSNKVIKYLEDKYNR